MKKVIVLLLVFGLSMPVFSQSEDSAFKEVGLMFAPGYSTVLGGESWKGTLGLQIGIETNLYRFNTNSTIYGGVLVSLQGGAYEESYSDYDYMYLKSNGSTLKGKVALAYISIPILYNNRMDNGFYVEAGLQPGFLVSAKDKIDGSESYDYKDHINSFDLGLPLGAGFWINDKLSVGARAVIGLTTINKSNGGEFSSSDDNDRNLLILGILRYNFKKYD